MTAPAPVAELERRLRWPALPTLLFLTFLASLLALAAVSMWLRPDRPHGLPGDDALRAEASLPDATYSVLLSGLRHHAAAFGGATTDAANDAATLARAADAERTLARWAGAHPREPRVRAALGALALVRHDYLAAADRYREACERSPHYAEGRLGWGVALALEANRTSDPWQRRALALRAIAQFAAVDATAPEYLAALYNRARTLHDVGRREEALTFAQRYLTREPEGVWADRLRAQLLAN
jgi:tetratricopeptide (TPR) repeat protein